MKKTLFSLLLCLVLGLTCVSPVPGIAQSDIQALSDRILASRMEAAAVSDLQAYLDRHLSEKAGVSAEWYVIALCQTGHYDFTAYRSALNTYLKQNTVRAASTRQKIALALAAAGDRTHPFITATMADAPGQQGIMSIVYALHLMNNGYESPVMTQEEAVSQLLQLQLADGGWAITGSHADADVTAMTLQALSCHKNDALVAAAIDRALALLAQKQLANGGYMSYGVENLESAAQVWIALSSLGIDALQDARFIKNGQTLLDAVLQFELDDHQFSHVHGGNAHDHATVQVLQAAIAYQRMLAGKGPLLVLDAQNTDAPSANRYTLDYRAIAAGIILLLALAGCIALLLTGKRSPKNFLTVLAAALALVLFVFTTDFSSAGQYYQPDAQLEHPVGQITLSIRCDAVAGQADFLPADGIILPETRVDITEGDTVYTVLTRAARAHHIHMESSGPEGMIYMNGIAQLYELAFGDLSGWLYFVNGQSPSISCDQYPLKNGDTILWQYTLTMGRDL